MTKQPLRTFADLNATSFNSVQDYLDAEAMLAADHKEQDPLWQRELELEELMLSTGADNTLTAADKAKQKGNVSHLGPYRRLTELLIGPISDGLAMWMHEQRYAGRAKAVAFKMLADMPPQTAAIISLRILLDRVGSINSATTGAATQVRLLALAAGIGSELEAEARMIAWKKLKPAIWHGVQRDLSGAGSTTIHRRRVNTNRFNKKVRDAISWVDWTHEQRLHTGLRMVDMMVVHSKGRIRNQVDPLHVRTKANDKPPYVVSLDATTEEWLLNAFGHELNRRPVLMPTVMRPAPWSDMWDGGYLTGVLPQRSLIRFKADNVEQAKVAVGELGRVDMPQVYDAVNTIQEVPWTLNSQVYAIAREMWDQKIVAAGFPQREPEPKPFRDPRCDEDQNMQLEWRRAAAKAHNRNALKASQIKRVSRVLDIAEIYKDDERFYFPHVLDFRGRMYPLPLHLQPQGDDLARGLLTFADGKPLGAAGAYWLAIHVANVWGQDKVDFPKRIKWVTKNEAMFRAIAADPIKNNRWALPKSHPKGLTNDNWQALAATLEWVRYLDEGDTMVSALPVRLDGTCNGIQHLSAMVRDEVGGAAVNLVPAPAPRDIYTEVGAMVEARLVTLTDSAQAALASKWLEAVNGKLPREVTKRPVMILPYGGTKQAYYTYTKEWMEEYDPQEVIFPEQDRHALCTFLVAILWQEVEAKLPRARQVQGWLQQCARLAATTNLPLRWTTPIGFVVRHFYGQPTGMKIETLIDGQRVQLMDWRIGKELAVGDQMRGIPPNYTHSMDGCVLMKGVNLAYNAGIDSITCIHDAYGTVAADVDMLNACIREAFIWTYQHPVLENFRSDCAAILDDDINTLLALPSVPAMGNLKLEDIRHADYFIA